MSIKYFCDVCGTGQNVSSYLINAGNIAKPGIQNLGVQLCDTHFAKLQEAIEAALAPISQVKE